MTNNYKFPPPTTAVEESVIEEVKSQEIQVTTTGQWKLHSIEIKSEIGMYQNINKNVRFEYRDMAKLLY